MSSKEIIIWSKNKLRENKRGVIWAVILSSIFTNLSISYTQNNYEYSFNFGFLFYFVEICLISYLVKYINDEEVKVSEIFSKIEDFFYLISVRIVELFMLTLWTLCLVIPGIVKAISYSLLPYLLLDERYKSLSRMDLLRKSEEIMNGHKMDYFKLSMRLFLCLFVPTIICSLVSFITLDIFNVANLSSITFAIIVILFLLVFIPIVIYVETLSQVSLAKFLYDVLNEYNKNNKKNGN